MTAGTGIRHSEFNHSAEEVVHLLQIWIKPKTLGLSPGYQEARFHDGELTLLGHYYYRDSRTGEILLAFNNAQLDLFGRQTATAIMAKKGLTGAELDRQARHRVFPGNRPSTTLLIEVLTPFTLGGIVALYEHRVFVEGVILGINSFDQWGVELGKELALALAPVLEGSSEGAGKDGSTLGLAKRIRAARG